MLPNRYQTCYDEGPMKVVLGDSCSSLFLFARFCSFFSFSSTIVAFFGWGDGECFRNLSHYFAFWLPGLFLTLGMGAPWIPLVKLLLVSEWQPFP